MWIEKVLICFCDRPNPLLQVRNPASNYLSDVLSVPPVWFVVCDALMQVKALAAAMSCPYY